MVTRWTRDCQPLPSPKEVRGHNASTNHNTCGQLCEQCSDNKGILHHDRNTEQPRSIGAAQQPLLSYKGKESMYDKSILLICDASITM